MRKIIAGLMLLVCTSAFADELQLNENIPERYVVKPGDTLWDISAIYLKEPWFWPEIWQVNPQVANPHLIYPGDVLMLVWVDGKPRLVRDSRNVKLSPQVKVLDNDDAIAAIPLESLRNFLNRNRVVDDGVLEAAPYVLGGRERKIMAGMGDAFYARGELPDGLNRMGVYRKGKAYIDPVSEEVLGIRATDVGSARLDATENDVSTFTVLRSNQEIRVNDRLLPLDDESFPSEFYPKAPDAAVNGLIMSVEGAVNFGGQLDIISLNLGTRDGMKAGDTLAIFDDGEMVKDRVTEEMVQLPDDRIGVAMVFKTHEKMSFAVILRGDRQVAVGNKVRNP